MNSITEWAKIKTALRSAQDLTLESMGHTWETFRDLEAQALSEMIAEVAETEYGKVQKIPDSPVQFRVRRLERPDELMINRKRLILLNRTT